VARERYGGLRRHRQCRHRLLGAFTVGGRHAEQR
jgi:hypothetical protein